MASDPTNLARVYPRHDALVEYLDSSKAALEALEEWLVAGAQLEDGAAPDELCEHTRRAWNAWRRMEVA